MTITFGQECKSSSVYSMRIYIQLEVIMNPTEMTGNKPYPEDDCACDFGSAEGVFTENSYAYLVDSATGELVAIPLA